MNVRAGFATAGSAGRILWPLPLALFVARVALEATRRPLPGPLVMAVAVAALLGGGLLARMLARRNAGRPALPGGRETGTGAGWRAACPEAAWLLLTYVCWPSRAPVVAGVVACLAAMTWLLSFGLAHSPNANGGNLSHSSSLPQWTVWVVDTLTFAISLGIYVATLSPDVLPADSGEFQLAAARWGVAHPPGFPLYTLVGALFVRLVPSATPAYALNLLSAILAALTLVFVARATRTWAGVLTTYRLPTRLRLAGGVTAALTLGSATTFWAQATIANIRTPSVLCVALVLWQLARFASATRRSAGQEQAAARKEADHALLWLGAGLGLALGHHPSLAFATVIYLLYVVLIDPRLVRQPRRWWRLLIALPVGLLPFIYLPIRGAAGAPLAPDGLDTLSGFLHHVRAEGFAGDMFAYATATDLPDRLALLPTLWLFQFNRGLLIAAAAALLVLAWRDWRLLVVLAGSLAIHTFVTITYRAPQTVEYLMPAGYPPVAVVVGLVPALVSTAILPQASPRQASPGTLPEPQVWQRAWARALTAFLAGSVLTAALVNGWAHNASFVELADDHSTRATAAPLLEQAPAGAVVLADWHWATPLWYLQQVEGLRPDVDVRYVYNVAGEEYRDTWRRRVEDAEPERPLILTHFYEFSGFTAEPWGPGFWVSRRPMMEPSAPLMGLDVTFGEAVRLLGYRLSTNVAEPGGTVECVLAWQAVDEMEQAPSLTLRMSTASGERAAQADQALGSSAAPGEVRFERLVLPLYPWLAPGPYQLTLGAYIAGDEGFEDLPVTGGATGTTTSANLTTLQLEPLQQRPYTRHSQSVPYAAGPELIGVDYDRSLPDMLRVYLHVRGTIPSGCQAVVSAAETGPDVAVDLPALGTGDYQTVIADLPGTSDRPSLRLRCSGAEGEPVAAGGAWGWAVDAVRLPRAQPGARFVSLGGAMAVVGAEARTAMPGEDARVDVILVGLRPLVDDGATSVRLMDAEGRWLARHDMQPALGSIPTLKWIRGSHVVDRHPLPVPADYAGDTVQAALVAYERFRQAEWVVLDDRFGQVPLGVWPQP